MSESKLNSEWARTANILCMMANINRDEKKKKTPFKPSDFMPKRKEDVPVRKLSIHDLCAMFKGASLQ